MCSSFAGNFCEFTLLRLHTAHHIHMYISVIAAFTYIHAVNRIGIHSMVGKGNHDAQYAVNISKPYIYSHIQCISYI